MADRHALTDTLPQSIPAEKSADLCQERCVHADEVVEAKTLLAPDEAYVTLAEFFGALADATRAKIVHLLVHQELCTCDIAAILGVSDSCVSQHLRILRTLRLVTSRRAGKFVYYRLDDSHIALLIQLGLTHQSHDGQSALEEEPA
jgi:DNA-binding transcriptional ArsR family regulator